MLRELIAHQIALGPVPAALAIRQAVRDDLDAALDLADDRDAEPAWRVAALLAVALAAQDGAQLPERAAELLEDDLLVDAAISARAEAALTGVLARTSPRDALRKYLAVRLAAAGSTGIHVASLLLSVGDLVAAGRAALPALVADVRANTDDETVLQAIASILVEWNHDHPELARRLCAALPADVARTLAATTRAFDATLADLLAGVR